MTHAITETAKVFLDRDRPNHALVAVVAMAVASFGRVASVPLSAALMFRLLSN